MSEPTRAVWITHNPTTVTGIRGLLQQLEAVDAASYAQIRIIALDPEEHAGIQLSQGELTLPDGYALEVPERQAIPWDKIPAEGLLILGREKDS